MVEETAWGPVVARAADGVRLALAWTAHRPGAVNLGLAGMEVQDLILQVNGETVRGVDGFVNLITALPDKQPLVILALDHRTGQSGYVQLKMN